jgi:fatty acid desaturase
MTTTAPSEAPEVTSWRDLLSRNEIAELRRMNDWRSWLTVAFNWGVVLAAMGLVYAWPNPLTLILALLLIGARQLGIAVLMHDASHYALFENRKLNNFVGNWLGAYTVWSDVDSYRPYHREHHLNTWTEKDPDLNLATPFPITRDSMLRKVGRDLSGRTGLKFARFAMRRDFGTEGTLSERTARALRSPRFRGLLITNGVLFAVASLLFHPAVYLLWPAAYLTTNTLVTRIRAIAEHSMTPDPTNELLQTRTTLASWWERLFLAPNRVNYHLEHHLVMTVPHYNLPRMHEMLKQRGALEHALIAPNYWSVLRQASSKAA